MGVRRCSSGGERENSWSRAARRRRRDASYQFPAKVFERGGEGIGKSFFVNDGMGGRGCLDELRVGAGF